MTSCRMPDASALSLDMAPARARAASMAAVCLSSLAFSALSSVKNTCGAARAAGSEHLSWKMLLLGASSGKELPRPASGQWIPGE